MVRLRQPREGYFLRGRLLPECWIAAAKDGHAGILAAISSIREQLRRIKWPVGRVK